MLSVLPVQLAGLGATGEAVGNAVLCAGWFFLSAEILLLIISLRAFSPEMSVLCVYYRPAGMASRLLAVAEPTS
jgi:hypothetical protein